MTKPKTLTYWLGQEKALQGLLNWQKRTQGQWVYHEDLFMELHRRLRRVRKKFGG